MYAIICDDIKSPYASKRNAHLINKGLVYQFLVKKSFKVYK